MRVLIVDDDEVLCALLAEVLEQEGIAATWVTDSAAGYALAVGGDYDLCIVDVRMPGLSGPEWVRRLKASQPRARVVLISAFADAALRATAARLGVGLLSKPFSPGALLEALASILSQPGDRGPA